MNALIISDLHLTPERSSIARAFCRYLQQRAPQFDALYILGDFFEYWVGDDAMDDFQHDIAQQLRFFSDSGKPLYFMVGNRDFAIGKQFLALTGAQWLKDPTLITHLGQPVVLTHGDLLCSDDKQYLRYRRIIRNPLILALLRRLPLSYRQHLGNKIRRQSKQAKTGKQSQIMDVTSATVVKMMQRFNSSILIHGHTHRPAIHTVELGTVQQSKQGKRYVLGDWTEEQGWEIVLTPQGIELNSFPITN